MPVGGVVTVVQRAGWAERWWVCGGVRRTGAWQEGNLPYAPAASPWQWAWRGSAAQQKGVSYGEGEGRRALHGGGGGGLGARGGGGRSPAGTRAQGEEK